MRPRALLAVLALALGACGSSAAPPSTGPVKPSPSARVAVVVMENEERSSIVGSPSAPYITRLARTYATAPHSYAIRHPSLPNYLALVSGSTQGVTDDCTGCAAKGPNLGTQLSAKGISWRSYAEGLPSPCFTGGSAGRYAKKHDPFAYWASTRCGHRASFVALDRDLARGTLPAFSLVVPDLCHDMHDCSVATGDRFLSVLAPRLLRGLGPHGYLVLTFDEGSSSAHGGGQITTIVAGPGAARGRVSDAFVNHYGVLRTIEDTFGLSHLGGAADATSGSLRGLLAP
jgi:acid phosphatase